MNTEQIAALKARALEVVNGFKTVRDQIARDALNAEITRGVTTDQNQCGA